MINIVADLDPYLLQPLNTLLWKRWTSGELITVMIKLCAFYGRRQSSRSMFGLIFQSKFVLSPNLQEIFSEPFQQLTKAWLPSALLSGPGLQVFLKLGEGIFSMEMLTHTLHYTPDAQV